MAAGLRPDPLGELKCSPYPLAAIWGLLLRGGERRGGRERRRGKREKKGTLPLFLFKFMPLTVVNKLPHVLQAQIPEQVLFSLPSCTLLDAY